MNKFKAGDKVTLINPGMKPSYGIFCEGPYQAAAGVLEVTLIDDDSFPNAPCGHIRFADGPAEGYWWPAHWFRLAKPKTKEQRAIARKEAELAALKEAAAKKAQQAAERKAKQERAKILRNLSPAGKRVVAMLQAGSARDFGCQRENVIALVAAITGDKADDIKKALQ